MGIITKLKDNGYSLLAKQQAEELTYVLGNETKVLEILRDENGEPKIPTRSTCYNMLYEELYKRVDVQERVVLKSIKDDFILVQDMSVLWTTFEHLNAEREEKEKAKEQEKMLKKYNKRKAHLEYMQEKVAEMETKLGINHVEKEEKPKDFAEEMAKKMFEEEEKEEKENIA